MFSIEPGRIDGERIRILARMDGQTIDDGRLKRQARAELRSRLKTWSSAEKATIGFDPDRATPILPVHISADRVELPIVRAISDDRWRPSFGVTQQGRVYVTHDGHWLETSLAVYVTGLSPLLDQVAAIFLSSIDPNGGCFYERDGSFAEYPREGRARTFACVAQPGPMRRLSSAVDRWRNPVDEELVVSADSDIWPSIGVLGGMGYRVGNKGLPARNRRRILKQTLAVRLVAATPKAAAYLSEWGEPGTADRRSKIENCLRTLARNARGRTSADMSAAIADWEADLSWLKRPLRL